MKKEKIVRAHTRKTKSGKVTQVKQHTAKYDAASMAKEALKKVGSGEELKTRKELSKIPVSLGDFKVWYNWNKDNDPENETALKVENTLIKALGKKEYNKFHKEANNTWTKNGHKRSYESMAEKLIGESTDDNKYKEYIITNPKNRTVSRVNGIYFIVR